MRDRGTIAGERRAVCINRFSVATPLAQAFHSLFSGALAETFIKRIGALYINWQALFETTLLRSVVMVAVRIITQELAETFVQMFMQVVCVAGKISLWRLLKADAVKSHHTYHWRIHRLAS